MRFWIALGLAALLLLFFGCVSEERMQELRFSCVNLSSGSFAAVPECDSEESCYKQVEGELFGNADDSQLDFGSRRILEEYKNRVALSWRFFNEGQKELEQIRNLCWSGNAAAEISLHLNRLNNSLLQAFQATDEANQEALAFLVVQKEWMNRQELGLVREEPLFSDWVGIQDNLNALQAGKTADRDSFAGKLFQAEEKMDAVFAKYNLEKRFVSAEQLADVVPEHREIILQSLPEQQPLLPVFAGVVIDLAGRLADQQRYEESVQALADFPAFPFFSAYHDLVGKEDSVASETGKMAQKLAIDTSQARQEQTALEEEITKRLKEDSQKLDGIRLQDRKGFGLETVQKLVAALQPQTRVSLQGFEVADFSENQEKLSQKLLEIQKDFQTISQNGVFGSIPMGKSLFDLQQTKNRLQEWEDNFLFLENELEGGLVTLCQERVRQMDQQSEAASEDSPAEELRAKIKYWTGQFREAEETNAQLEYCSEAIQAFEDWQLFLEDRQKLESEQDETTGECFGFLETAFKAMPEPLQGMEWRWKKISGDKKNPLVNSEELRSQCQGLLLQAKQRLQNQEPIVELQNNFLEIQKLWIGMQRLYPVSEKEGELENEIREVAPFFAQGTVRLERVLPVLEKLSGQTKELKKKAGELFETKLKIFLEENVQASSFSETIPAANQNNWVTTVFLFSNPSGIDWPKPVSIELPGKWQDAKMVDGAGTVQSVRPSGQKLSVSFSKVPTGETLLRIRAREPVSTGEKDVFLFANQFRADLERTIALESNTDWQELSVSTQLPSEKAGSVRVLFRETEKPFSQNGNRLEFLLENVSSKDSAEVFFTVSEPVQVDQTVSIQENRFQMELTIRNQLPESIPSVRIELPLPEELVTDLEAVSESGSGIQVERAGKKMVLPVKELSPGQEQKIIITGIVDNEQELLEGIWQETRGEVESLAQGEESLLQREAQQLLAELWNLKQSSGPLLPTGIFELANKSRLLKEKIRQSRLDQQQYLEAKQQAEQKKAELKTLSEELEKQGFPDASRELEGRIRTANQQLSQANLAAESRNFSSASVSALKALALLEEGNTKNRGTFEQKAAEIQKNAKQVLDTIQKWLADNPKAQAKRDQLNQQLAKLVQGAWQSNPSAFLEQLAVTQQELENGEKQVNEWLREKIASDSEEIQQWDSLIGKKGLENQVQEMLDWLKKTSEEDAIQAGAFLPFRKTDLEKRLEQAAGLALSKQKDWIPQFESLQASGNFLSALELFEKNRSGFEKELKLAEGLQAENGSERSELKQQAGVALEKAEAMAEKGWLDSAESGQLVQAQKAFQQGELVQSLVLAKKIQKPLESSPSGLLGLLKGIPLAIVPIIGFAAFLAWSRFRQKKQAEKEVLKTKVERVPNEE